MTRYGVDPPDLPPGLSITPFSPESIGWRLRMGASSGPASTAWPSANLALYVPFRLRRNASFAAVRAMVGNGATASGNLDVGVYDESWNRLASLGSTAQSGTSVPQLAALALTLRRGRYYLGLAFDNNVGTVSAIGSITAGVLAALGCAQQASAFPLPATATPVACTQTIIPAFGLSRIASL